HRLANHRLNANDSPAAMMLPISTTKKPHHRPKKKPPPTANTPPGSSRILQIAKTIGYHKALHTPHLITRSCNASVKSITGRNRDNTETIATAIKSDAKCQ